MARIVLECLNCRHKRIITDEDLKRHGLKPGAPLVTVTKRVVCSECGSHAVKAERQPSPSPTSK